MLAIKELAVRNGYQLDLRRLENYYSYCTLNEENEQTIISYNCVVKAPTANIK